MPAGKRKVRDPDKGSEFGGVDGLLQPPAHEPDAREQLIAIHQRFVLPTSETAEEVPGDMRNDVLPASTDQYKGLSDD